MKKLLIIVMLLISVISLNAQNTLTFKFGDTLTGKITKIDESTITLQKNGKYFKFLKTELKNYTDNSDQVIVIKKILNLLVMK